MTQGAGRRMVIGIGNPDRGDDAAGLEVARLLRQRLPGGVEVSQHAGDAAALLERLDGVAAAVLVDACVSGAPAGTVLRIDAAAAALPRWGGSASTHGLGLGEAIELARALGRLPMRCIVYAIEGQSFALGAPLSPPISKAVVEVARRVAAEMAADPIEGREARVPAH